MGGGSQTQDTNSTTVNKPPKWFSDAAIKSLEVADRINQAGYVPYMGNQVAAFTPMQQSAMQGANDWLAASNGTKAVDAMAGMPKAKVDGSGVAGYESATGMMRNLELIKQRFPQQYALLSQFGGDLLANPAQAPGNVENSPWQVGAAAKNSGGRGGGGGGGGRGFGMSELLTEGMKDGPFGAMMAFEGLPYFKRNGASNQGMTSAYQRLADRRGLMPPAKRKKAPVTQPQQPPVTNNPPPAKWW